MLCVGDTTCCVCKRKKQKNCQFFFECDHSVCSSCVVSSRKEKDESEQPSCPCTLSGNAPLVEHLIWLWLLPKQNFSIAEQYVCTRNQVFVHAIIELCLDPALRDLRFVIAYWYQSWLREPSVSKKARKKKRKFNKVSMHLLLQQKEEEASKFYRLAPSNEISDGEDTT